MPFFMTDDQFHLHRKTSALLEHEGANGVAAIGLWTLAGSQSQAKLSDGTVTVGDATRVLLSRPLALRLAKLLVKYGLWEELAGGGWQFHDWGQVHKPGEQVKGERERRKEIRTPEIIAAVRARDGDQCRYCGRKVNFQDRRGERGGCYDHIDPGLVAGASNLVVCCRACNSRKARRSPEQAGMTLRPITSEPNTGPGSDLDPNLVPDLAETTSPRARARSRARSEIGLPDGPPPEVGVEVGPHGERGRAGPVPPGSVPPLGQRPSPVGSGWHGWRGPPPDVEIPTCADHNLELPCRTCNAAQHDSESTP